MSGKTRGSVAHMVSRATRPTCDILESRLLYADVTSFTLINADTDQPISGYNPIPANAQLNLAALPTRHLNIRANTSGNGWVGSVKFDYDSASGYRIDNSSPFFICGGSGGD